MDNIFQEGNINTSCCQVSHKHEVDRSLAEFSQLFFTSGLVHCAINKVSSKTTLYCQLAQVLNVIPSCTEDDRLLITFDSFSHRVYESCFFLIAPDNEEVNLEQFWQFVIFVDSDHPVVLDASKCEVLHLGRDSRGEKQALPTGGHDLCDSFQLLCKTHLEESVTFIVNDHFDLR